MLAIEISTPGGPDVLRAAERPEPVPGPGDVLIRVAAAGVNRPDVMQRQGRYPPPPGASDLPGLEVAGTVAELGGGVGWPRIGDRVCALVSGGGYAEFCVAPAMQCLPVPTSLTMTEAAAVPETYFTVWTNLLDRGALKARELALIHGGTSGIGTTAIQLGRAFGARMFATAGSDEKCRACERLGAEHAINYRSEDFAEAIKTLTAGRGVDVILDIVGGDYLERNVRALALGGRLVQIGLQGGVQASLDLSRVLARRLTITGSTLRPRSAVEKGAIATALREHVWPLLESGRVKPVIYKTFSLREAAEAHRVVESSEHIGKVVLVVSK
jgi:NADPH:quinone reductase